MNDYKGTDETAQYRYLFFHKYLSADMFWKKLYYLIKRMVNFIKYVRNNVET